VSLRLSTSNVDVQEEGEVLIPADKLRQILQAEEEEATLTIEAEGDVCRIRGQDAKFKVYGYDVADFPPVPGFPTSEEASDLFEVSADQLAEIISRTIFSTARETSRYAINGVLLVRNGKKLEMVATDGRRLALARTSTKPIASGDGGAAIVPTKALQMAQRLLPQGSDKVRIGITDARAVFDFGGGEDESAALLASKLVEGTFPPYEDVIPRDNDKKATFSVDALGSAVRRAALLTNEESRGVRMSFGSSAKTLNLASRAPEMGEANIDVQMDDYAGDDIEIGFNPQFITDGLKVIDDPSVVIEMKSPNKPGLMKSGNDFMYVVMPVNLQ
jgi:DNA polymerase-3 subunit beta